VTLYQATALSVTMIGFASTLPLVAAGVGVLRTRLMPDWLGYLAFLAAIVSLIGAFGIFVDDGAFVPAGP
jgi:energy-converting hydrogenase Eha subunit A